MVLAYLTTSVAKIQKELPLLCRILYGPCRVLYVLYSILHLLLLPMFLAARGSLLAILATIRGDSAKEEVPKAHSPLRGASEHKGSSHDTFIFNGKRDSELWRIHGQRYDLRAFIPRHPGGVHAITLGMGTDCTALFESYHHFTNLPRKVLAKYR